VFSSSSGSCHGSDATWQETGHGSVRSRDSDKTTSCIKEAAYIQKQRQCSVNQYDGIRFLNFSFAASNLTETPKYTDVVKLNEIGTLQL